MGASSRLSIRLRLTALAVLIVSVGLIAGLALVLAVAEDNLLTAVENAARQRARDTAALVAAGDIKSTVDDRLVQVVGRNGMVLAASNELAGRPPLVSRWPDNGLIVETVSGVPVGEGGDYLVVGVPTTLSGSPVAVYAASSLETVTDSLEALTSAMLIAAPVLFVILSGASWLLVGRVLRPVEEAHELQRRFTADAAHELRTPLAAIQARLEVGLAHPADTDWVELGREVHREGVRVNRLTEELLALSQGNGHRSTAPVDLDELVLSEIEAVRARGKVSVDLPTFSAVRLSGSADGLRRLIRNLLDNAERHANNVVAVSLNSSADSVELVVADDGDGIPVAERERVFERFYRLQPARDRDSGGAGLGLSIARNVVDEHGGRIWITDSAVGAEVRVRLPLGR